jgi:hypothetical protein
VTASGKIFACACSKTENISFLIWSELSIPLFILNLVLGLGFHGLV